MRYQAKSTTVSSSLLLKAHIYLIQKLFILILEYACVNIVIIVGIFSLIEFKYGFSTPAAPGRHPIPRDRATAPSPTHTAALAIPGEIKGVAAKPGKRRFFKVALPKTATNRYIFCWLNGRALDSGQTERQLDPSVSAFSLFLLLYCCTIFVHSHGGIVGCWWIGFSAVHCCTVVRFYIHDGGLVGCWWVDGTM